MFVITYAPKFNMHSEFHKVWIKERCEKTKLCSSFKVVPYFQEHCQMHQRQKESSHMFFICIFLNVLFHRILKTTLAWVTKLIHPSLSRTVPVLTWSLPQSQGNKNSWSLYWGKAVKSILKPISNVGIVGISWFPPHH